MLYPKILGSAIVAFLSTQCLAQRVEDINRLGHRLFRFEHWEIMLPKDWHDKSESPTQVYLESTDRSKGMYCVLLTGSFAPKVKVDAFLQKVANIGRKSREGMTGYNWERSSLPSQTTRNHLTTYIDEYYESAKQYSITTIILISDTAAVRVTFHDYACSNLKLSRDYFSTSIKSLALR
jgi:hypothetical protein